MINPMLGSPRHSPGPSKKQRALATLVGVVAVAAVACGSDDGRHVRDVESQAVLDTPSPKLS